MNRTQYAFLLGLIFLLLCAVTARAFATRPQPYKVICHHTPANEVTIEFQNEQSYEGHLGTPHSGSTYDTDGECPEPTPTPTEKPECSPTPTPTIVEEEPTATPTPTEEVTPTPTDTPTPTATPTAEPKREEPKQEDKKTEPPAENRSGTPLLPPSKAGK